MGSVRLRTIEQEDLEIFFEHQQDAEAVWMAAFTAPDPSDRETFDAHWDRVLGNSDMVKRTILADGTVVGHIVSFEMFGDLEITYWIDRAVWGTGIATTALEKFLDVDARRPLHARCAKDNAGSARVLEKCGFVRIGDDRGFANARNEEIDEWIYRLS